jgi:hypothetical protein
MSSFSLILTEKCNWGCEYCYFPRLSKPKEPKLEIFQKHLPYIKEVMDILNHHDLLVNIDIQGGEVGLIPLELLQYYFQTIKYKTAVSTNGLFLKRGYHLDEKIRPFIGMIMWHVATDLTSKIEVDYNDDDLFISKGIVHNDVDEIVTFLKENDHILFDYIEFEFDLTKSRKMDVLMYHDLLNKIKKIDNITDNARSILESRLSEKEQHRDNCRRYNGSILIDLVNENICLCQRQLNESIPLNKMNLIKRLKSFPNDLFDGGGCSTCTRLYAGKFRGNVIERALKIRRLL